MDIVPTSTEIYPSRPFVGLLAGLMKRIAGWLVMAFLIGLPALARACPVCYSSGEKKSQWAYYGMTIFLSLMPFLLLGFFGYWVYRVYFKARGADGRPS